MRIDQLELQNFRGFDKQVFRFPEQMTVLIGDNGTGKTAIVDALAIGASALFLGIDGQKSSYIQDNETVTDIRSILGGEEARSLELQFPVIVKCHGKVHGEPIEWKRTIEKEGGRTTSVGAAQIKQIANCLQQQVRAMEDVTLPVLAYHGTGRLWLQLKKGSLPKGFPDKESRLEGYTDCLSPRSDKHMYMQWIERYEFIATQEKKPIPTQEAVKHAITECLQDWCEIEYSLRELDFVAKLKDGQSIHAQRLSDGYRNMIGMVANIAYRAARLNPHLGYDVVKETPGIVLIDEIDLHLHPRWQRRVVADLKRIFPKVQFVAITHSPFIIQSLKPGELINLDERPPAEHYDQSIEDIAEDVMGVEIPQRSKRYLDMMDAAKEYYQVLQQAQDTPAEELERLKRRLDELSAPFSDNIAYHAFLEMERTAAGLGRDDQ